jgi:hypothetical protein
VNRHLNALAGTVLFALTACSGTPAVQQDRHPVDPVMNMLHEGILDLEENVEELNERIVELQQLPPVPDPTLQQMRALDLAAWQLHQQQWLLQRERLSLAVHQIQQAQVDPPRRSELWAEWAARQQHFLTTLDDLRTQRHALERKRLALEEQLLERYFK